MRRLGQVDGEAAADEAGLRYLAAAGYDPIALVDFFERVRAQSNRLAVLSNPWKVPPRDTWQRIAPSLSSPAHYLVTTSAFHGVQARVALPVRPGKAPSLLVPAQ